MVMQFVGKFIRRGSALLLFLLSTLMTTILSAQGQTEATFKPIPTQFIAALAEPTASSGNNAQSWGLWAIDPGPRGVRLNRFSKLQDNNGVAPAGWQFDSNRWWLEEHGLIMESPTFPLAPGKYVVTGDRDVTTVLTIYPPNKKGDQDWELDEGTLYDVTHLACRSAVYTSNHDNVCTPEHVQQSDFPVKPGAAMPLVANCNKQDYAVLIVIGVVEVNELSTTN